MSNILLKIKSCVAEKQKTALTQSDLVKCGLNGIQLRPYQLDGVQWLTQCLKNQQGCILGDEMGLGKTCQTISLLVFVSGAPGRKGPFLVLSPLSVMENWRKELESFAPSLTVLCYKGDKERRAELHRETQTQDFDVLLTTYELCLKDASFLRRWSWKVLVVDEPSAFCRLFSPSVPSDPPTRCVLTFVQPNIFTAEEADNFTRSYADVQTRPALAAELQGLLEPFLLRRVKSEVAVDLPRKTELLMYHGMSALQKKYYKAILMKDLEAFGDDHGNGNRLLNILMNLRKCVDHPYLFNGVEPEPFEMGEHLVEASGKLSLLDGMLTHLHKGGHRILLFSQMTRMLDILQDYMEFRGYSYERLDGSVRGEERNLAVKNFSSNDIFVFLLSTKAGGVGLNLTAADTVIFMDSDFNPQNDLQAAARCHRIGQNRPVKVIRLLARDTVEEIMYSRAASKLRLTDTVMEDGRFSLLDRAQAAAAGLQLGEILKFGVDKLLSSEESSVTEVKLEKILGPSRDGQWADEDLRGEEEEEEEEEEESDGQNHMYYFEGKDYSKESSRDDQRRFERLLEEQLAELQRAAAAGRALRNNAGRVSDAPFRVKQTRKPLTEAELELRSQRREEAAAKRAKLQEDAKKKQQERKHKKKLAWWESCGYASRCLPPADSEEEEEEEEEEDDRSVCSTDSDSTAIRYVLGDVTHPHAAQGDAIIVHCVDDSGRWGRGGLFTALEARSDEPRKKYESAGKMKDLDIGNVLLFPIDDKQSRLDGRDQLALIVAQRRDKDNNLSGILLSALDDGLKKIYAAAKRNKASVHLPRIGHATRGFNWYGTERLVRKHLASRGVATFIYYHNRAAKNSAAPQTTSSPKETQAESPPGPSAPLGGPPELPDFMRGVRVFFYNLAASERRTLARHLVTYDGDEEEVMNPEVTHVVAEVESAINHRWELRDLCGGFPGPPPGQKDWLNFCFSKQGGVDPGPFPHPLGKQPEAWGPPPPPTLRDE
uniref:Chromodomain helicase DNA binding protein 1-like n=1 Tax=Gasterosteus aculeatus aculeatus TaxID=481459 RepID=A0AAQ4PCZ8_GASAC